MAAEVDLSRYTGYVPRPSKPQASGEPRSRGCLNGGQVLNYVGNIVKHRPFQLELLRWNHDRAAGGDRPGVEAEAGAPLPPRSWGEPDVEDGVGVVGAVSDDEDDEDASEREAFQQLECLCGSYRYSIHGGPGGGIQWTPMELAGVFLRHRRGPSLLWLPEAGPNFLLQACPGGEWTLGEVASLERRRVTVDKWCRRSTGVKVATYANVSVLRAFHRRGVRLRAVDPHLTDGWLQAAEDLRTLWAWDWRPVRQNSSFEVAQAKFVYTVKYPLADTFRGFYGEVRWQWQWLEDGRGRLCIRNRCWGGEGVSLWLDEDGASYSGLAGESHSWVPAARDACAAAD